MKVLDHGTEQQSCSKLCFTGHCCSFQTKSNAGVEGLTVVPCASLCLVTGTLCFQLVDDTVVKPSLPLVYGTG